MSRKLEDLESSFRGKVHEFLAKLMEVGLYVVVVDTLRTKKEQEENVKKGVSWTLNSRHLVGKAVDVCPVASYMGLGTTKLNWDDVNPAWARIGEIGERVGLKWGVWVKRPGLKVPDWRRRGELVNIDLGHFEEKE